MDAKSYFTAFQLDRAEDFRSVQRLIWRRRAGGRARARWRCWPGARRGALFERLGAAADPGRRGRRGGHLAAAGGGRPAAVRLEPPARASTSGLSTQDWPDWFARRAPSRRRSAPASRRSAARSALALVRRFRRNWWAPAALVVIGLRRDHDLAVPGRDRPDLQRLQEAAAGADALGRARARAARPAWTWARSTGSTRAAARRRPTPTSTGSATPSASCSTTT